MLRIESITDMSHLRQVAQLLEAENQRLHDRLAIIVAQLAALQGKSAPEQLQLELSKLQEQMALLRHKMFGRSSERMTSGKDDPKSPETEPLPRRGHGPREQAALPLVEQIHTLEDSEQICEQCSAKLEPMGQQSEDSEEISVVQRKFVLVRHKRQKYRCRCNAQIKTAPAPQKLIASGRYSLSFAVEVAVQKYAYHLPLERQVKMMRHEGLVVDSQTLWDQIEALGRQLLPTAQAIHKHILTQPVLHADETRWMLLQKGGSKQWHAWALSTMDAVFYHIDPSRGADVAIKILGDYQGVVVADGYAAYQRLARAHPALRLAHCMAHVRRKFLDALPAYPQGQTALELIGKLYEVERTLPSLRDLPPHEMADALKLRTEVRNRESLPLLAELHAWAVSQSALPGTLFATALGYMLSLWPGLCRFAHDPLLPIDNNLVERDLRAVVVGRKNHYGSKSLRGTQVAATFYSLVETALRAGLDPRHYLLSAAQHALHNPGAAFLPPSLQLAA